VSNSSYADDGRSVDHTHNFNQTFKDKLYIWALPGAACNRTYTLTEHHTTLSQTLPTHQRTATTCLVQQLVLSVGAGQVCIRSEEVLLVHVVSVGEDVDATAVTSPMVVRSLVINGAVRGLEIAVVVDPLVDSQAVVPVCQAVCQTLRASQRKHKES
jgi:hypothetical protein